MMRSICFLVLVATTSSAYADAKSDAKKHIDAATGFFEHRYWAKALDELNIAYTLDPQPDLLYAIAQLHVALGDCTQAITFYERYIATKPSPQREAVTKKAINICKTNPPPPEPGPETTPPPPPPPEHHDAPPPPPPPVVVVHPVAVTQPWYTDKLGDALVGAGVIAGVVAAIEYSSSRSDLDAATTATTYPRQSQLYDSAQSSRNVALALGGAGAVLVVAGVLHYSLADRTAFVVPTDHGGAIVWSGRW